MATSELVTLYTEDGTRIRLAEAFAQCRDRTLSGGHIWERSRKIGRRSQIGTLVSLQCARCESWKHVAIGAWGQIESTQYEYVDGYSLTADEQPTRDSIRIRLLERMRQEDRNLDFDEDGFIRTATRRRNGNANAKVDGNGKVAAKGKKGPAKKVVDVAQAERDEVGARRQLRAAAAH